MISLGASDVAGLLRTPGRTDNKYRRGVVTLVTGGASYPGAGLLSVAGAARAGAGLVRYQGAARELVLGRYPETVLMAGDFDAAVLGCGWDESLAPAAREVLGRAGEETPVVIDAGLLDQPELWSGGTRVLTPHYGEAARLWKLLDPGGAAGVSDIANAPVEAGRCLAALTGAVVVLKGADTHVVDGAGAAYCFRGVTGWAGVAGSGDVLAGVIGAFLAQRCADRRYLGKSLDATRAIAAAVWLHGNAAAVAAGVSGADCGAGHPILAQEIAAALPEVWQGVM